MKDIDWNDLRNWGLQPLKSDLQIKLENQGCVFNGQEALSNHEENINKPCYCKRPLYGKVDPQ